MRERNVANICTGQIEDTMVINAKKDSMIATIKVYYNKNFLLSYQDRKLFDRDIDSFR